MARPIKHNADYFPHDADASEKKTITILYNNFGHEGISLWWQLLEKITGVENHVIDTRNPEDLEYWAGKLHLKPERLIEILDKLALLEAIDRDLWSYRVIWCQNLVNRLADVYKKRKQELPNKPIVTDTRNHDINTRNHDINTRKPTKESKVNKSKVNKSKVYGEFENVLLTEDEYTKLLERFGEKDTTSLIEKLSAGIASKGYKYKSHYATILNWAKRDDNPPEGGEHGKRPKENRRDPLQDSRDRGLQIIESGPDEET